jgi:hypothetical protein
MRLPIALPLIAVLSLGACNKAADPVVAGSSDPAANAKAVAAAGGVHFQPGLYQSKVEIKQLDMPGMPPAALAAIKSRMVEKPLTYCLTPEDAAKGAEAMKQRMGKGQCQFDSFNAAGGTIDSSMTCQLGGQGTMHVVAHGTFTDTGSVTASTMDMAMGGAKNGVGKMHVGGLSLCIAFRAT